ncbi:MAG: HAMP domain-containing histidine kinase [Gemmatimonadales bacterium]|nr:HAMP domain-containing histidine kinase [Gemmatimonadales bacterium]
MRFPAFTNTLHFRLSALFLVLLSISGGAFWFWINATILSADMAADEEEWYDNLAEVELDSLAITLGEHHKHTGKLIDLLTDYGGKIDCFDAEVIVFDAEGNYLASSQPDSLKQAVLHTDSSLLAEMSGGDWDFSTYPDQGNIDSYENRIFEVDHVHLEGDPTAPLLGYLAASFRPIIIGVAELDSDTRTLGFQAVFLGLVYAALSGLIILGWTTRRLKRLSEGIAELTAGNLSHRVKARSKDEIGSLGRGVNTLAESLDETLEQLRNNEQFQRQLIANIGHDLRTPLASVRGYVETMCIQAHEMGEADRQKYLNIITGNLDHLDRLIEHTLILSRFDSGQITFQMEEFSLAELADSVLQRCLCSAEPRGIHLELKTVGKSSMVRADPLQIAQVLQNLVENGIKFNRPGGSVKVVLTPNLDRVNVAVTDTGIGIAPEDQPHIFERFFTGDKSRSRPDLPNEMDSIRDHLGRSAGLGLSIAAKIAAGHDSNLTVESEPGSGTTFRFNLPGVAHLQEMKNEA